MTLRSIASPTLTKPKRLILSNCLAFFDFDNTLTTFDVFDEILERFSVDDEWRKLEEAWQAGKIGSKECLEGQLRSVRVTKERLARYLSTVTIDPHFHELLALFKGQKIPVVIVSDNFSFIVREILRRNGISGVRVYYNRVRFSRDRMIPSFPYGNGECSRCAHCKKVHLLNHKGKTHIYVGDGLSDICPAEEADLVFAKGSLLEYLKSCQKPCVPFENLGDVYHYLLELDHDSKSQAR